MSTELEKAKAPAIEIPTFEQLLERRGKPVVALDKDQAEARFNALVTETYQHLENTQEQTLKFYFHLGAALAEVTDATHAETYGEHRLTQFATKFNALGVVQLKHSSFKYARQFYNTLSPEALGILIQHGIVWTNVRYLCANRVTPELVEDTLQKVAATELRQSEIKKYLDEQLGMPKRRHSRDPKDRVNAVVSAFENLIVLLEKFMPAAAKMLRGDEDDKKTIAIALDTAEELGSQVIKDWTDQIKKIRAEQKRLSSGAKE